MIVVVMVVHLFMFQPTHLRPQRRKKGLKTLQTRKCSTTAAEIYNKKRNKQVTLLPMTATMWYL